VLDDWDILSSCPKGSDVIQKHSISHNGIVMTRILWIVLVAATLVLFGYLVSGLELEAEFGLIAMIGLGFAALISVRIRNHHPA
jgi:hypothetical protein